MSLLARYEAKLVDLYEAAMLPVQDDFTYDSPQPLRWWARFIPGPIAPEWWRWRFVEGDRADTESWGRVPNWLPRLEWRWERFCGWLAGQGLEWLWDHKLDLFRPLRWLGRARCRWTGHPAGVGWFNPGGSEPDMTCRECGMDLG